MTNKKKQQTRLEKIRGKVTWQNTRKALAVISAVLYLLAVITLAVVKFVPAKYLLVIVPISALGMVVLLRAQFTKKASVLKNTVLITLSLLIGVVSVGAFSTLMSLSSFVADIQAEDAKEVAVTKPFIVYVSGIDTYGEIDTVSRSDVNMLIVVNPQTNRVLLVNTPRDYYVQLHGTTGDKDKLTHAGTYGIEMSRKTLEDLYGVPIDAYVRVNFSSLVAIIDALGGVDVYSDYDFKEFHTGYNRVNGEQALEFARERYSFSEGDRQRGKNQQHVIEAIITKMNDPKNMLNYRKILNATAGAVQTNMGGDSLAKLVNHQLDTMHPWKVTSISVDGTGAMLPTYSAGAQPLYVMVPDEQTVDVAKKAIADTWKVEP